MLSIAQARSSRCRAAGVRPTTVSAMAVYRAGGWRRHSGPSHSYNPVLPPGRCSNAGAGTMASACWGAGAAVARFPCASRCSAAPHTSGAHPIHTDAVDFVEEVRVRPGANHVRRRFKTSGVHTGCCAGTPASRSMDHAARPHPAATLATTIPAHMSFRPHARTQRQRERGVRQY